MNMKETIQGHGIVCRQARYAKRAELFGCADDRRNEICIHKTSQSKATVSMTVMYYQASPDPEGWSDPWHQYDMELNFVSGNQGYAKVTTQYKTLVNGLLTTVKKDDLWYFKIDSDELPDKTLIDICIGNSEGNDDGDGEGSSETW